LVKYLICGSEFKALTSHLNRTHKVAVKDCKRVFPDAKIMSDDLISQINHSKLSLYKCEQCGKLFLRRSSNKILCDECKKNVIENVIGNI